VDRRQRRKNATGRSNARRSDNDTRDCLRTKLQPSRGESLREHADAPESATTRLFQQDFTDACKAIRRVRTPLGPPASSASRDLPQRRPDGRNRRPRARSIWPDQSNEHRRRANSPGAR